MLRIIIAAVICVSALPFVAHADGSKSHDSKSSGTNDAYPAQLSLRPLTLFQGMTETRVFGGYWRIQDGPNVAAVSLEARFGIIDWWDASARTLVLVRPDFEWRDVVTLATRVLVYDSARFDFAPGVLVPINFDRADGAHTFPGVALNATARAYITSRYSVICGEGLLPVSVGRRASLDLNCSVVLQGSPNFGVRVSGQLAHIRLHGNVRESTFPGNSWALTYFYSIGNWLDVSVTNSYSGNDVGLIGGISIRN